MIPFNKGLFKAPKYSSFELHHDNKMSFGIGDLIPAYWNIMFPGDRFRTDVGFLARFAPMLAPVMQRFDLTIDWHFVPMRLILGERKSEEFFNLHNPDNPGMLSHLDAPSYLSYLGSKNLLDYLGYPQFDNLWDAFKRSILEGQSTVGGSDFSMPTNHLLNTVVSEDKREYSDFMTITFKSTMDDRDMPNKHFTVGALVYPLLLWYAVRNLGWSVTTARSYGYSLDKLLELTGERTLLV